MPIATEEVSSLNLAFRPDELSAKRFASSGSEATIPFGFALRPTLPSASDYPSR